MEDQNVEKAEPVSSTPPDDKADSKDNTKRKASIEDEESSTGSSAEENEKGSSKRSKTDDAPLDLAITLGYKDGDRIEVQWEVERNGETNILWWAATLMAHDGRTTDSVAIRTLRYDPSAELGYPESTFEDVVFLGDDLLVTPDSQTKLKYRREGEEEILWYSSNDLDEQLNSILMEALDKNKAAWKTLTPAQQAMIAEKIATKKDKLIQVLRDHNDVINLRMINVFKPQINVVNCTTAGAN